MAYALFPPREPIFPVVLGGQKPALEPAQIYKEHGQSKHPFGWLGLGNILHWMGDVYENWRYDLDFTSRPGYEGIMTKRGRAGHIKPPKRRDTTKASSGEAKNHMEIYDATSHKDDSGLFWDFGSAPSEAYLDRRFARKMLGLNPSARKMKEYLYAFGRSMGAVIREKPGKYFKEHGIEAEHEGFGVAGVTRGNDITMNSDFSEKALGATAAHELAHARLKRKLPIFSERGAHDGGLRILNYLSNYAHEAFGSLGGVLKQMIAEDRRLPEYALSRA